VTERTQVWFTLRRELGPLGHLTRIEHPIIPGTPDVLYTIKGVTGWLELKKFASPVRCPSLTVAQVGFANRVQAAGGLWFLLGRYKHIWLLYNVEGAERLLRGVDPCPLFSIEGELPLKELLMHLAELKKP